MNLFEEIRALNFPDGQYIIVGSGIMAAKGIREANDLDIVVTPELFEKCRNEGWEVRPWTKPGLEGKEWLKKDHVDLHLEVSSGEIRSTADELLREAEVINGVPFITLEQLTVFKRAYGRPKDFEDIKLIEAHLERRKMLDKVTKLHGLFETGKIPVLAQHEVNPGLLKGSRENYLYFTLPPSINFQRQSPAMWAAALRTWDNPETNYLFFPERVEEKSRKQIQNDLLKHKLALQLNKHTDIWIAVSKAFSTHFKSDPRDLFKTADWDVIQIHKIIQQDMRRDFPYISGPKMANYWLYILSHYTDAKFKNMREISIIPDTHVLQSSIKLGLTDEKASPLEVAAVWKELLKDGDLAPVEMHPVLWNWSRNNFLPEV